MEIKGTDQLTRSFAKLGDLGITSVKLIEATHSDMEKLYSDVRTKAVENGRKSATDIANAMGQKLGDAFQVTDVRCYNSGNTLTRVYAVVAESANASPVDDQPLEFKGTSVRCNMTIKYVLAVDRTTGMMILE